MKKPYILLIIAAFLSIPHAYADPFNQLYTGAVPIANGGTGAITASAARTNLGVSPPNDKFSFNIGGTLAVANNQSNWAIADQNGIFTKCKAIVQTNPTGQSIIFDIQKSTDNGVTFTSLWASTPSNKPTIAATAPSGTTTSFDTTTFNYGDIFRIDVDQVGSGTAGAVATVTCVITPN